MIALCVPVRDEERLLPGLLAACAALDRSGVELALCLYLDGCTDGSAAIAEAAALPFARHLRHGPRHGDANAGRARAAAMAIGLALPGCEVLLSTDADSRPERDWVQAAVAALAQADVAAGRVLRFGAAADLHQTRVERYYDRLHAHRRRIDPVAWEAGGCHFGGGANLGVRAEVYRALSGFRALPSGEDATFLDDAARGGWRVRHDPAMRVHSSARRHGRAPGGLAVALDALDRHGLPEVPHPAAADWQYRMQALARAAFARADEAAQRTRLGRAIGLSADHVLGVARDCANAEAFAMRIVPAAPTGIHMVPLVEAEAALDALERTGEEVAA
ncbi:glycosyltransferase [Sphingomonas silueang]|uniref:glycosyltransferase n=1 Tax=Sphingomonas silueang TaxID=3156617 RepID=UPI0032B52830